MERRARIPAMLIGHAVADLRVPALISYGIVLVAVVATVPRASWRATRWPVLLAIGTMCGLLALHLLYAEASLVTRIVLLVAVVVLAVAFVAVSMVTSFKSVAQLRG